MTETFPFSVMLSNGYLKISEPTNDNYVISIPVSLAVIETLSSNSNYYSIGAGAYAPLLDYTLCTNLTTSSRSAQIDAIIALT